MRAFIASLVAILVVSVGAYVALQKVQKPVEVAFSTPFANPGEVD